MNSYIPTETWEQLVDDLEGSFMTAATGMGDLRGKIIEALAVASVMPSSYREDAEVHLAA